jgi:DNA-binding NtrC family response regulator
MRNVIEQAVLLASGPVIDAEQLNLCSPRAFLAQVERVIVPGEDANTFPLEGLELAAVERDLLQRALEHTRWNVTHAARLLGLSRDTMRYRIDKFSLTAPVSPEAPRIGH